MLNFMKSCSQTLEQIFQKAGVDETHGLNHALKVLHHCDNAILCDDTLSEDEKFLIRMAALLHDADDRKYFPTHKNYENLRHILQNEKVENDMIEKIIRMVQNISFSKNGDAIDEEKPQWFYYPRYSDRLQAIGIFGIVRCYQYSLINQTPVSVESTKEPRSKQELEQVVKGRQQLYLARGGKSDSVIDHIFDKLIHISLPKKITNPYLRGKYEECKGDIQDFVLKHSASHYADVKSDILALAQQFKK